MMHATPAIFVADALGLDFLNSIAVPTDATVEFLGSGDDLLAWLDQAGAAPADVLEGFRKNALPGELDAVAAQARSHREWFRAFVTKYRRTPLPASAAEELEPLNRVLARDEEYVRIAAADTSADGEGGVRPRSGLVLEAKRRWRSPDTLLQPIARAMADVICDEDFSHVKACEGSACTLLFLDRTRGRARRWCNMAVCGNRAKQAAHRARGHSHH